MEAFPGEPESEKILSSSEEESGAPKKRQSANEIALVYTIYIVFFFAFVYMVMNPQEVVSGASSPVKETLVTIGGLIGMLLFAAFPASFIVVPTNSILSRTKSPKSTERKFPAIAGMLFNLLLVVTTLVFIFLGVERLGVSSSAVSVLITLGAGAFLVFASFKFLDIMDWMREGDAKLDKKRVEQPQSKKEPTKSDKAIRAALPVIEAYVVAMMGVLSFTIAVDPARLDYDFVGSWLPWLQVGGLAMLTVVTTASITLFKDTVTRLRENSVSTTVGVIALIIHAGIIAGTVAGTSFGELWIEQQTGSTVTKFIPLFSLALAVVFNYLRKNQKEVDEHNKQLPQSP